MDPHFSPEERIYRRLHSDWVRWSESRGREVAKKEAIRFPVFSVNRSKYSSAPEDVLTLDHFDWRVGVFRVRDLPLPVVLGSDRYSLRIVDDPTPGNPAHAEIRLFKNSTEYTKARFKNKIVKDALRQHILYRMLVLPKRD